MCLKLPLLQVSGELAATGWGWLEWLRAVPWMNLGAPHPPGRALVVVWAFAFALLSKVNPSRQWGASPSLSPASTPTATASCKPTCTQGSLHSPSSSQPYWHRCISSPCFPSQPTPSAHSPVQPLSIAILARLRVQVVSQSPP